MTRSFIGSGGLINGVLSPSIFPYSDHAPPCRSRRCPCPWACLRGRHWHYNSVQRAFCCDCSCCCGDPRSHFSAQRELFIDNLLVLPVLLRLTGNIQSPDILNLNPETLARFYRCQSWWACHASPGTSRRGHVTFTSSGIRRTLSHMQRNWKNAFIYDNAFIEIDRDSLLRRFHRCQCRWVCRCSCASRGTSRRETASSSSSTITRCANYLPHTLHTTHYALHPSPFTLQPDLHPTPYTLHPAPDTLHPMTIHPQLPEMEDEIELEPTTPA